MGDVIDRKHRFAGANPLLLGGIAAVILAEAALLGHSSLNYDELFSIYFARQEPGFLLGEGWRQETNPPLYFLLLRGWMALFGDSAVAVRSLSLLAGAVTVPVMLRIARAAGLDRIGAWLAVFLYLTSTLAARYAIMARPYALWLFVLSIALLALLEAMAATAPSRRWALAFAAAGLTALYLHDATLVFLVAADVVFVLVWAVRHRAEPNRLITWLLPQLLLLAAGAPQLLVILAQRGSPNIAWIPPLGLPEAIQAAIELLSGREYPFGTFQAPAWLLSLILILIVAPVCGARRTVALLGGLALLGLALLAGVGLLLPRAALWLLLVLAPLQAAGLRGLPAGWLRRGLIALSVTLAGLNTASCLWSFEPEPWRDFLTTFERLRQPTDAVILLNAVPASAFSYYRAGEGADLYRWDESAIDGPGTAVRTLDDRIRPLPPIDEAGIRALLEQGRAVWLVSRLGRQIAAEEALTASFAVTERMTRRTIQLIRLTP
ncbi:MAG: glycosyltransferase family 39 protein [Aliidongia sp.]